MKVTDIYDPKYKNGPMIVINLCEADRCESFDDYIDYWRGDMQYYFGKIRDEFILPHAHNKDISPKLASILIFEFEDGYSLSFTPEAWVFFIESFTDLGGDNEEEGITHLKNAYTQLIYAYNRLNTVRIETAIEDMRDLFCSTGYVHPDEVNKITRFANLMAHKYKVPRHLSDDLNDHDRELQECKKGIDEFFKEGEFKL